MAKLIEREDGVAVPADDEHLVNLNEDNHQAVTPVAEEDFVPEPTAETTDDDVPDKYKGKSMKDVIAMHQEAEKHMGKQSGEVGELRKAVDQLIQAQLSQTKASATEQEEEIDFFDDPDKAVERAIANHPSVKAAQDVSVEMKKAQALAALERKHPDMNTLLASSEFGEWVSASPVRTRLMQQAHTQFDSEAADELFSLYKERASVVQQTLNVEEQERKQAVKSASTGAQRGTGATGKKPIYRRADVINLMRNEPERYAGMADEIMQAYAEGRVRH